VDDLGDDVLVGEADDKAVLGRIVLVLRLGDQPLTGIVIGCAQSVMRNFEKDVINILFPSLRRLYLTWNREKYALFFWSLDLTQSQRLTLQTRIRSNSQRLHSTIVKAGCPMVRARATLLCAFKVYLR
jgi:hypothetical protein